MPEMRFHIRWPDGTLESCYSPSLVIKELFGAGRNAIRSLISSREVVPRSSSPATGSKPNTAMPALSRSANSREIEAGCVRFTDIEDAHVRVERFEIMKDREPRTCLPVTPSICLSPSSGAARPACRSAIVLKQRGIDHLVFEKHTAMHVWRDRRWDNFCLVTPNWQCALPGHPYDGSDPHGFMKKDEIIAYLDGFKQLVDAPLREGVAVTARRAAQRRRLRHRHFGRRLSRRSDRRSRPAAITFRSFPAWRSGCPRTIVQIHSEQYRNPASLPDGDVLVVGSGQSGAQIAEDLHLAGPQGSSGDRQRAALRALLSRPRRRRLARRHGLLRHAGRATIRCAKACATTPIIM